MSTRGLAELHIHQYGDIAWQDFLSHLSPERCALIDWSSYENEFAKAYGTPSGVADILKKQIIEGGRTGSGSCSGSGSGSVSHRRLRHKVNGCRTKGTSISCSMGFMR